MQLVFRRRWKNVTVSVLSRCTVVFLANQHKLKANGKRKHELVIFLYKVENRYIELKSSRVQDFDRSSRNFNY